MSAPRTAGTHGRADWAGVLCKGLGQGWGLGWLGCCRSYLGWIVMVIITSSPRQHDRAPPSSSYTILPLCFSSTYTRQSANNTYHNNTQQQRRVSYRTWGKLSLELLSLVVWESLSISPLCTPISAKICHLFWHFCQAMLNAFKKVMAPRSKVQQNMPGPPLHRFSEYYITHR